jgi:hypothetical protein
MNPESRLLNALKSEQVGFAVDALKRPMDKTEFEYGFRSGVVHGLQMAVEMLVQIASDNKSGKFEN